MDAVGHLSEVFSTALGSSVIIETTRIQPEALSASRYVFLQQQPGYSPVASQQDDQRLDIVVYGQGTRSQVLDFAQSLTELVRIAWREQIVSDSGWVRSFSVEVSPYVQNLPGIPSTTIRVTSTLTVRMRDRG